MPYEFHEFATLSPAQQAAVEALTQDDNNPLPIGPYPIAPLFGYVDQGTQTVVAWAWGAINGPQGDLHLIVLAAHQRHGLGARLALRYFIRTNMIMADYVFSATNAVLHAGLGALGFQPSPNDPDVYSRARFTGVDLIALENAAHQRGAFAHIV